MESTGEQERQREKTEEMRKREGKERRKEGRKVGRKCEMIAYNHSTTMRELTLIFLAYLPEIYL